MKKTLFSLLACASLTAPAMATNWYAQNMFVTPTADDTTPSNYKLFILNVNNTTYSDFATTLGSLTYDEFQTQYSSSALNAKVYFNNYNSLIFTLAVDPITGTSVDTGIAYDGDNAVPVSDIYATWVYNNGEEGDKQAIQYKVVTTYKDFSNQLGSNSNNTYDCKTSDWQSFSTTPEPATATLSLLALAGLASRRRRH